MWQSTLPAEPWWMSWLRWRHELHRKDIHYCISTICPSAQHVLLLYSFLSLRCLSSVPLTWTFFSWLDCSFPAVMLRSVAHWNSYLGIGLTWSKVGNNVRTKKKKKKARRNTCGTGAWRWAEMWAGSCWPFVVCFVWLSTAVINHMLIVIHEWETEPRHY